MVRSIALLASEIWVTTKTNKQVAWVYLNERRWYYGRYSALEKNRNTGKWERRNNEIHVLEKSGRVEQGSYDGGQGHMIRWVTKWRQENGWSVEHGNIDEETKSKKTLLSTEYITANRWQKQNRVEKGPNDLYWTKKK